MHIRAWCIFKKCLAHGNLHIQSKTDGLKKCRVFFDCTSMLCLWCPQGLLQGHTSQYNRIIHPCSDECGPAQWRFCPDLPACCWVWAGQVLRSRVWCWHILWITMQWSWRWPKKTNIEQAHAFLVYLVPNQMLQFKYGRYIEYISLQRNLPIHDIGPPTSLQRPEHFARVPVCTLAASMSDLAGANDGKPKLDLSDLATELERQDSVRDHLRQDPVQDLFDEDAQVSVKHACLPHTHAILKNLMLRTVATEGMPQPPVAPLREALVHLYQKCSRSPAESTIIRDSWYIRKFTAMIKMKTRKQKVSTVPCLKRWIPSFYKSWRSTRYISSHRFDCIRIQPRQRYLFVIAPVAQVKKFQELCLILNPGLKDRVLHVPSRRFCHGSGPFLFENQCVGLVTQALVGGMRAYQQAAGRQGAAQEGVFCCCPCFLDKCKLVNAHMNFIFIYIYIWLCLFLTGPDFSKGKMFELGESYPRIIPRIIPPNHTPENHDYERFFWGCLGLQWPQQS